MLKSLSQQLFSASKIAEKSGNHNQAEAFKRAAFDESANENAFLSDLRHFKIEIDRKV